MITVSINGSSKATNPSETGSWARAAAWAIGADPCPASFENKPRLTPLLNAKLKPAPKNPPTAAVPVNTSVNMEMIEGIIFW